MPTQAWYDAVPQLPANHVATKSAARAARTAFHIMDKPTDVILLRHGAQLTPQTVRIEGRNAARLIGGLDIVNQQTYQRDMVIFGVKDHPTLPTLDIQANDEFWLNGSPYRVTQVTDHAGERQAFAERTQG